MRASIGGIFFHSRTDELVEAARAAASITHAHPLGIEGAVLIAVATGTALSAPDPIGILRMAAQHCHQTEFIWRVNIAESWLTRNSAPDPAEVRSTLGNGVAAAESCVTAIYLGLRFLRKPFLDLQAFVANCGGDVDTIGAMSGALWGAANGLSMLPESSLELLEDRERFQQVANRLHETTARPTSR
jgi:poly(ADP-ribose) glycohydrolase ARH3